MAYTATERGCALQDKPSKSPSTICLRLVGIVFLAIAFDAFSLRTFSLGHNTRCSLPVGQLSWDKAQESCVEKGGTLVRVRDIDEHDWIHGKQVYPSGFQLHLSQHDRFAFGNLWIGCRPSDGNSWKWINSDGSKSGCCTRDGNSEECFSE